MATNLLEAPFANQCVMRSGCMRRMAYDLRDIPIPQFIPGPGKSWVVPGRNWAPRSIWDLVFAPAVFEARPTDGPRRDSFRDVPLVRSTGRLDHVDADYKDPCYFTPSLLAPTMGEVAVLPSIAEERWVSTARDAPPDVRQLHDVGVQTGDEGWHGGGSFEDAGVRTGDLDYEDDDDHRLSDVGVQTYAYAR